MIKILHVEDDADIREIAQLALGLSGDFEVVQSASGEEALLMVQAFIPDVLLLDVMMPGMTGRQTLERMREIPALEKTPAIFMTARAQNSEVEEGRVESLRRGVRHSDPAHADVSGIHLGGCLLRDKATAWAALETCGGGPAASPPIPNAKNAPCGARVPCS